MRILLVGSGGREHALAWAISASALCEELIAAPGNAGIAELARCAPVSAGDIDGLVKLARAERVDFVVVGPEQPLVLGLVDRLEEAGIPAFGPGASAARLEGSKAFMKEFCARHGIPTARYQRFGRDQLSSALTYIREQPAPIVVKADGLAAGKGVVVADTTSEAEASATASLSQSMFGPAGETIVIEEFLEGEEVSIMAVCDGERSVLLPAARDFKRAFDGDRGPNTGGMGAFAPVPGVDAELEVEIEMRVVTPILRAMASRGTPFRGTLYCGLMLGPSGIRVVEFNARFGDPETEVIVPLIGGNFAELLLGAARGALDPSCVSRTNGAVVAVALVAHEYPEKSAGTATLAHLEAAAMRDGVRVFGAALERQTNVWRILGGRAAYVMAGGATLDAARERAYAAIDTLRGAGWRVRRDIAAATTVVSAPVSDSSRAGEARTVPS